jgi:hypothetical protein
MMLGTTIVVEGADDQELARLRFIVEQVELLAGEWAQESRKQPPGRDITFHDCSERVYAILEADPSNPVVKPEPPIEQAVHLASELLFVTRQMSAAGSADAERLELARQALIESGYFTADQVGADIAPRIVELLAALTKRPAG